MSDQEAYLRAMAWRSCCDFHDTHEDIREHLLRMCRAYGWTSHGEVIMPPPGWRVLLFRELIPNGLHREYIDGFGWARERRGRSTVTPIYASIAGNAVRAFAVPI